MLLRLSTDEFWFSVADSDMLFWLQGINVGMRMEVAIDEIDVCPVQIQGPKSLALMVDLIGDGIRDIPSCAKTRTATTSPSAGLRPLGMSQTQTLSC